MAKGYVLEEDDEDYRPSRPARRVGSQREVGYSMQREVHQEYSSQVNQGYSSHAEVSQQEVPGYSAHYAESPVIAPPRESRSLPRRTKSRNSTLQRGGGEAYRSPSRHTTTGPGTTVAVSKVTRSRSWGARTPGVVVYNRNGEPAGLENGGYQEPVKPASTIGIGYRPNTAMSGKSHKSGLTNKSGMTAASTGTVLAKNSTKAGVAVETMSAPNPFCPNTKGVCCLMVLVNLALILVAIGFIIVLQLTQPPIIWNIGIVILVFGFITLFISLVYCMCICQETPSKPGQPVPGELYWTHHWQKNFTLPEMTTSKQTERWDDEDKFPEDDVSDTSSRDYPRLYLESDYGQRTDRENDLDTDLERAEKTQSSKYHQKTERSESPVRYT